MVKRLYLFICLLGFHLLTWAGVVTGTVKDAETGEELIGATLITENGNCQAISGKGTSPFMKRKKTVQRAVAQLCRTFGTVVQ